MKPTLQQEENLRTYLADVLKYKETIDEVFDHILCGLKDKTENLNFQQNVNQILNEDFGGGKGLVEMEKQQLRNATWEAFTQVAHYTKSNFKFPNIFYTTTLWCVVYYTIQNININYDQIILIFPLSALFFLMLALIRKFFVGYYTGDARKSIRDIVIGRLIYGLNYTLFFSFTCYPIYKKQYQYLIMQHPLVIAGFLTTYILFIIATIRISIEEFKRYKTA